MARPVKSPRLNMMLRKNGDVTNYHEITVDFADCFAYMDMVIALLNEDFDYLVVEPEPLPQFNYAF